MWLPRTPNYLVLPWLGYDTKRTPCLVNVCGILLESPWLRAVPARHYLPGTTCPGGRASLQGLSTFIIIWLQTGKRGKSLMVFVLRIYKYCTAHDDWNVTG